ncbi:MAG: sigma-70 family RNA polymerase sigma factor [Chloroflexota bacterium]|nr:sigma-70 family RNA polymerase sigma factor [Chloroflexota bacterium]MDE2969762.1 sigma-70 family RNA polymerase sigma factor [Chloroflexota bacterium]
MQDTENLVRSAQEGNLSAFGQVYEAYYLRVYRYAAARVGQGAEAEDITQEVFLKALNSLNKFKFTGPPFAAWLFRIAHNLVIDRARHYKAAAAATSGPPAPIDDALSVPGDDNVEEQAMVSLDMEALREALDKVTKLQRQVIELRFLAGLSLAETAAVMSRNENAIKALQHSALGALRRLLAPQASAEVVP